MLLVRADKKTTEIIEGNGSGEELLKDVANIADAVLGVLANGDPQLRKVYAEILASFVLVAGERGTKIKSGTHIRVPKEKA